MAQDELVARIAQAGDEGWTTLDLSREGFPLPPGPALEYLPPEIGNLTGLTQLNLTGNQLTGLPPEIGNLTSLTELNLHNNQLRTVLPPEIGNLTSLTVLDLSANVLESSVPFSPEMQELMERGVIKTSFSRFI